MTRFSITRKVTLGKRYNAKSNALPTRTHTQRRFFKHDLFYNAKSNALPTRTHAQRCFQKNGPKQVYNAKSNALPTRTHAQRCFRTPPRFLQREVQRACNADPRTVVLSGAVRFGSPLGGRRRLLSISSNALPTRFQRGLQANIF